MKKMIYFLLVLSLSLISTQSAVAGINATETKNNKYIVPIKVQYSLTNSNYCSGVMISKNVLVTAGHCLLDESKQISKKIYVGKPGMGMDSVYSDYSLVVNSFIPDDYLGNTQDNSVGSSDIAFLVIDKIFSEVEVLQIASENDLKLLRSSNGSLRAMGYGAIGESLEANNLPHYFDGTIDSYESQKYPNTFNMSSKGGACSGDSGGAIMNLTPKKILLLGVITGTEKPEKASDKCPKVGQNGLYLLSFSAITRYSNVLHLALVAGQEELIKLGKSYEDDSQASLDLLIDANSEIDSLKSEIERKDAEFLAIKNEVLTLRSLRKVITCYAGKKSKQVTSVNPVCPTGYKLK